MICLYKESHSFIQKETTLLIAEEESNCVDVGCIGKVEDLPRAVFNH